MMRFSPPFFRTLSGMMMFPSGHCHMPPSGSPLIQTFALLSSVTPYLNISCSPFQPGGRSKVLAIQNPRPLSNG